MKIVDYESSMGLPLVKMWRESFERAVGVIDPHTYEEQLAYLNTTVLPANRIVVVLADEGDDILGFLASNEEMINQLYVHVDHQGKGIGSVLLEMAQQRSGGRLRLYTFKSNTRAQQFYEKHGFRLIARGFEETWQLEDLQYEWVVE